MHRRPPAALHLLTWTALGLLMLSATACTRGSVKPSRAPAPTVAGTIVTSPPPTTDVSTRTPDTSPTEPATAPTPTPTIRTASFAYLIARATAAGVPLASSAVVVASQCHGDQGRPHWGYYNNGAFGGAITEPDGAVIPADGICLNPNQPSPYSSLLHEMGHRYFWQQGLWNTIGLAMGGFEHATECFARYYGATTFGQGGCSAADADHLAELLGL